MKHSSPVSILALVGFGHLKYAIAQQVLLAPSGNNCPAGYDKLVTLPGCRAAMGQLNLQEFAGTETTPDWPNGCYHCDSVPGCTDGVWFNYDNAGSANGGAAPICALPGWEDDMGRIDTLFAGDSDIARWDTDIALYPNSANVGVGGYTCDEVYDTLGDRLQEFNPKWVVIVCGENDLWGKTVGATFADFERVIGEITAFGARALYLGTKPEPDTVKLHPEYRDYDARIRDYADALAADSLNSSPPPLVMVDVYPAFVELGNPESLYNRDGLHLSGQGYDYWNTWATTALADTTAARDCIRWMNNECDATTNPSTTTAATATTTNIATTTVAVDCTDDETWTHLTKKGREKGCNWIANKPWRRCGKVGVDGTLASESCPMACNDACSDE